jgi:thiamine-phosphate pyrophosphorylase
MDRRGRLAGARLYLVTPVIDAGRLRAALAGGVDLVQLRIKDCESDAVLLEQAEIVRDACVRAGALFILNDRPELAAQAGADGVHVGQDDMTVTDTRALVGRDMLVGLSTHSPQQVDAAQQAGVDYIGVGPVHITPTKPGRPAVGTELVEYAAAHSGVPWFAIGGIDASAAPVIHAAGARRIAVVRAITEAADPERAARELRAAITQEAGVGIA